MISWALISNVEKSKQESIVAYPSFLFPFTLKLSKGRKIEK